MPASGEKIVAADIDDLEDYTIRRPLVRLIQAAVQSIADNTDTALTFGVGSEDIDTHGFHDTAVNTTRITPTVAGYYQLTGSYHTSARTDYNSMSVGISKNGTPVADRTRSGPNAVSASRSEITSVIQSANGTTDYFEVIAFQDNVANVAVNSVATGSASSTFEAIFLRPL